MDINLVPASIYEIPSKKRVGAIVHDGTADMKLWPGAEVDLKLRQAWGDELQAALDTELKQHSEDTLEIPQVLRVAPGKLSCDFLAWVATRPPEAGTKRNPAPDAETIAKSVQAVLEFVASRNVDRIAFSAIGAGPDELPVADRLKIVVDAAQAYHDKCFADGTAPGVEEVLVCDADAAVIKATSKLVGKKAKAVKTKPKKAAKKAATKKKAPAKKRTTARSKLSADEIAEAQDSAAAYSTKSSFSVGQYINHAKFGIGRVTESADTRCVVLFEDGQTRNMAHGRA